MKLNRYLFAFILLISSVSFGQSVDHKPVNTAGNNGNHIRSSTVKADVVGIDITSKDHSETDYKLSGSVKFTVKEKTYTCTFSNEEVSLNTNTDLCDDSSAYYPIGSITVTNQGTFLYVTIMRSIVGYDEIIGESYKKL